ncbi:hypothetical protein ACTG9Q_31635 [Actinokineospora sp. 24-640]
MFTASAFLVAPAANAATTTSCTSGFTALNSRSLTTASCVGFVDAGSPYVFQLATLMVWNHVYSPPLPQFSTYSNAVATCATYSLTPQGTIAGSTCTFQT